MVVGFWVYFERIVNRIASRLDVGYYGKRRFHVTQTSHDAKQILNIR